MKSPIYILTLFTFLLFTIHQITFSQGCLPQGIMFNTQQEIDDFQNDYPGCTEIEGGVRISGDDISNLNGLNVLNSIGESLYIGQYSQANPLLTNLSGLDNLVSIGGDLIIEENFSLVNLQGLQNLESIDQEFLLFDNDQLADISHLNNLTYVGDYFSIQSNPSLVNLVGLENIANLEDRLSIHGNTALSSLEGLNNLTTTMGLAISGNPSLTTLEGLNNLQAVEGNLMINSNALDDFSGLESLTMITGSFSCGSTTVSSFNGLQNLSYINETFWLAASSLTNFTGLDNLKKIGHFDIRGCENLVNFEGLEQLRTINNFYVGNYGTDPYGKIFPMGNPKISNVNGLVNLDTITNGLYIYANSLLNNLDGLSNLKYVKKIHIGTQINGTNLDNPSLVSLTGLTNISSGSLEEINISFNQSLSNCSAQGICDYIKSPGSVVSIHLNADSCNSEEEVLEGCPSAIHDNNESSYKLKIFPNPASGSITIKGSSDIKINKCFIYSETGQLIYEGQIVNDILNVSMIPKGFYFIELITQKETIRKKLIIK